MTAYLVREMVRKDIPVMTPDTPIRRAAALLVNTRSAAATVIDDDGESIGLLS